MNEVREGLDNVLDLGFQELERLETPDAEYTVGAKNIAMMYDRRIKERELDLEDKKLELKERELTLEENRQAIIADDKNKEQKWRKILDFGTLGISACTVITTFIIGVASIKETRRGRRELFQFETDGCITSKASQMGYIPKPRN